MSLYSDLGMIPSVSVPLPPEISGVHFKVNLAGIASPGNSPLPGHSSLFAAPAFEPAL